MKYIGWCIVMFAVVRLVVSFINWACGLYLPKKYNLKNTPMVSVLIPARNEQDNIRQLLHDLSALKYKPVEILVYDDQSTDNTGQVVREAALYNPAVKLIEGKPLERGWLGKNFGCHQLAKEAKGRKLLFLDADVRVGEDVIGQSLAYMEKYDLKLLSVFPKQVMPTLGSYLSVPLMNWILLSLLPLPLVRLSAYPSLSAANGQFMFFDARTYCQLLPHQKFRNNQVEDISIRKYYKKKGFSVATLLGNNELRCYMYKDLPEAITGFSKNIFQFFGGKFRNTFLFAFLTSVAPFYLLVYNSLSFFFLYIILIVLIRVFISLASKQSVFKNIVLIIPQQVVLWVIVIKSYLHNKQKNLIWKGRNVSSV